MVVADACSASIALPLSFFLLSRCLLMIAVFQQFCPSLPAVDTIRSSREAATALAVRSVSTSPRSLLAPLFRGKISTRSEFPVPVRRISVEGRENVSTPSSIAFPRGPSEVRKTINCRLRLLFSRRRGCQPFSRLLAFVFSRELCLHSPPSHSGLSRHHFLPLSRPPSTGRGAEPRSTLCLDRRLARGSRHFAGSFSSSFLPRRSRLRPVYTMETTEEGQRKRLAELAEAGRKNAWGSSAVRNAYLEFFNVHGHLIYPSSPVVPHGDNTLLFINAGNQLKLGT